VAQDLPDRPPSVDSLARDVAASVPGLPQPLCVDAARAAIGAGDPAGAVGRGKATAAALLRPVINATGVLLHTNLGRSPLAVDQAATYRNLEYDLARGTRGSRSGHAATLLARAAGAEAALVVNNGAAAVLLVLTALAAGRPVVVSRGELVEIGGGFRIPEVLATSGAQLVEVGTTNRTRLSDYTEAAARHNPALLLKVHPSNYRLSGFTESVSVARLCAAGAVPVVADLGSGLLDETCPWLPAGAPSWLAGEPGARQTLAAGATVVTFSGDKLLGGPQAGIVAGRADAVAACARHPLARALRPGGIVLAALQDVALAYLRRDVAQTVPLWRMATAPVSALRARAEALGTGLAVDCASVTGGGTLPGVEIPSAGISIPGDWTASLRAWEPPVIARVVRGTTVCDLRTVDPADDETLAKALATCTSPA
jgi:L-seryl-tRNA(Ser) seleniumtransferase